MHARPRCRRCRAPVEVFDDEHWSSQCQFHNDHDDAMRREYREDEARAREEKCRADD